MASPFLKAAKNSLAETIDTIGLIQRQMQVAMFACGAKDIHHLKKSLLIKS
jgi:isopentenyl diphosphate isomerase/L-lactate dehydrogenase-like FMN-dependent dehydrogenase